MTTIVRSVDVTQDDAFEDNVTCDVVGFAEFGLKDGGDVGCGQVFVTITIPPGSVIDSATLTIWPRFAVPGGVTVDGDIVADQTDNALDFSGNAGSGEGPCNVLTRISDGIAAGAVVVNWPDVELSWVPALGHPGEDSPDIAAIIQQIIDRPGWARNNAIVLLVHDDGTSTGYVQGATEDQQAPPDLLPPRLTIDFTPPTKTVRIRGRDDTTLRLRGRSN